MAERRYGASSTVVRLPIQKDMAGRNSEPVGRCCRSSYSGTRGGNFETLPLQVRAKPQRQKEDEDDDVFFPESEEIDRGEGLSWLRLLLFRALACSFFAAACVPDLRGDDHRLLLLTSFLCHLLTEALQAFLDLELQTNYDLDDGMLLLGLLEPPRDLTTDVSMNCCSSCIRFYIMCLYQGLWF
jgi:hypothetical protein